MDLRYGILVCVMGFVSSLESELMPWMFHSFLSLPQLFLGLGF